MTDNLGFGRERRREQNHQQQRQRHLGRIEVFAKRQKRGRNPQHYPARDRAPPNPPDPFVTNYRHRPEVSAIPAR